MSAVPAAPFAGDTAYNPSAPKFEDEQSPVTLSVSDCGSVCVGARRPGADRGAPDRLHAPAPGRRLSATAAVSGRRAGRADSRAAPLRDADPCSREPRAATARADAGDERRAPADA